MARPVLIPRVLYYPTSFLTSLMTTRLSASTLSYIAPISGRSVQPVPVMVAVRTFATKKLSPHKTKAHSQVQSHNTHKKENLPTSSSSSSASSSPSSSSSPSPIPFFTLHPQIASPSFPSPSTAPPSPLQPGQFRLILREASSITPSGSSTRSLKDVRRMLQTALPKAPGPTALWTDSGLAHERVKSTQVPKSGIIEWIKRRFGIEQSQQTQFLIRSIQMQSHRPEWFHTDQPTLSCGFYPTMMAHIQLEALHLWLLHVRLRGEDSESQFGRKFIRILFDLFWAEQRHRLLGGASTATSDPKEGSASSMSRGHLIPSGSRPNDFLLELTETLYGGWIALDHALGPVMADRDKELDAEADEVIAYQPSSAAFNAKAYDPAAPDAHMLGALWRNTYSSDSHLHPTHLTRLQQYVIRTIEHLYRFTALELANGEFKWLTPPGQIDPVLTGADEESIQQFYSRLATPVLTGQTIRTESLPKWIHQTNDMDEEDERQPDTGRRNRPKY